MIDLKDLKPQDKRRRSKRKFQSVEGNGCTAQPKETILDMSVSKLAKAKTRMNLEPSLRKTVMIVNTIRKIEQEIENGKDGDEVMYVDHCLTKGTCSNTRPTSCGAQIFEGSTNSTEVVPVRLSLSLEQRKESYFCENNSEKLDNRCRSFGVTLAKSNGAEETFIDLTRTSANFKNKFIGKCSSTCITTVPTRRDLPGLEEEEEINFAEIDISLYDYDATLAWSEGGLQMASCGEFEDNNYKTSTGLSALIRRCSDDLKLSKSTDNSFTDDLDQIMQVLVGI